ncbi:MAG: 50S ribosomal protein L25 [Thermoleophilaceae bacterium]|nr:50S ribosomal protein L25 [Thermoleophilaceae bacterium]
MAGHDRVLIEVSPRESRGSRNSRRLRREGNLPGILYGENREPVALSVNERVLRAAIKEGHALMDIQLGKETVPVLIKAQQHHPVRGGYTHVDFMAVDVMIKINTTVSVELTGVEEAPGVVQGGVLDHVARELNIEVLPTEIPDSILIDVSTLELNAVLTLADAVVPGNLTVLDAEDIVIATITPPSVEEEPEVVEEETELVGDAEAAEAAAGEGEASDSDGE